MEGLKPILKFFQLCIYVYICFYNPAHQIPLKWMPEPYKFISRLFLNKKYLTTTKVENNQLFVFPYKKIG